MKENPFAIAYSNQNDHELVKACLDGSRQALDHLVKRHQDFIYNIALKMVLNPTDAEDITQEILIKMITKLAQFKGNSAFRTWLYKITFNHILGLKRQKLETVIVSFEDYGQALDAIRNEDLTEMEQIEQQELIEEAKIGCLSGMLLCLDRHQRAVYVLGDIFNVEHTLGAEILGISADNYRQRLSRARKDLHQFMDKKCGLVNPDNPCRCQKKTKGFIEAGWVDAQQLKFNTDYVLNIRQIAKNNAQTMDESVEKFAHLFQSLPFQEKQHAEKVFKNILTDKNIKTVFRLD
jgi:RNA polymerase sigma factor (sigma-70 family)